MEQPVFIKCEPGWASDTAELNKTDPDVKLPTEEQVKVKIEPEDVFYKPFIKEELEIQDVKIETYDEVNDASGVTLNENQTLPACLAEPKATYRDNRKKDRSPDQCNICGKWFTRTSTLREHLFLHSGQKPHKCNECGKAFAQGAQHKSSNDLRESTVETGQMMPSPTLATSMSSVNKMQPPIKKWRVQGKASKKNKLLDLACDYLSRPSNDNSSEYSVAKVWAQKLKELEPRQKLFAEKAINDILFEAQLSNLNRNSVQSNVNTRHTCETIYSPSCSIFASQSISVHVPSPQPEVQNTGTSEDTPMDGNLTTIITTLKPTGE
ncbi:uncharacterized protein [Anabrus simplex]|uniref:uncharacterized protein n=1 Tax=Anabrus simplex TaxID=316456 RepID=UPI0035A3BE85